MYDDISVLWVGRECGLRGVAGQRARSVCPDAVAPAPPPHFCVGLRASLFYRSSSLRRYSPQSP